MMYQKRTERIKLLVQKIEHDRDNGRIFYKKFLSTAYKMGLQEADIEDVWQTILVRLTCINSRGDYSIDGFKHYIDKHTLLHETGGIGAWVHACMVNGCRDYLREQYSSRRRRSINYGSETLDRILSYVDQPLVYIIKKEEQRIFHERISKLPKPHQKIIHLITIEGMTYRETAEQLCIPIGTVKSRYHQVRKQLRKKYTEEVA